MLTLIFQSSLLRVFTIICLVHSTVILDSNTYPTHSVACRWFTTPFRKDYSSLLSGYLGVDEIPSVLEWAGMILVHWSTRL